MSKKLKKEQKLKIKQEQKLKRIGEVIKGKTVLAIRPRQYDEILELTDGRTIVANHDSDCCEYNYADWSSLDDTGFYQENFFNKKIIIDEWEGGFRINGYAVNCYSQQNGYYSNAITVKVFNPTNESPFFEKHFWCEVLED